MNTKVSGHFPASFFLDTNTSIVIQLSILVFSKLFLLPFSSTTRPVGKLDLSEDNKACLLKAYQL